MSQPSNAPDASDTAEACEFKVPLDSMDSLGPKGPRGTNRGLSHQQRNSVEQQYESLAEPELCSAQGKSIRRAAMNLLACREHSMLELTKKLSQRFSSSSDSIVTELNLLSEQGLQSDQRFAESFTHYRSSRGQGPARIRQELLARGVAEYLISEALMEGAYDWAALAELVYKKKYADTPIETSAERGKRMRFMQYRGFTPDHFSHCLSA